jgi:outer membrane protein TolC
MRGRLGGLLVGGAILITGTAQAQILSLKQALRQAGEHGFASRTAAAQVEARKGQAGQTLQAFLPGVRFDAGYIRTTDPLGAFGAILRRRAVTPAAFDPAALNNPDVIGLLSTALILEQPLINVDAWYARRTATRGVQAAAALQRWTQLGSQVEAVRDYYGAVLVSEQVRTLEDAVNAARAHQRQAESMQRNGLVTQSDALLATVRAGEVQSQLTAARGALAIARLRLAMALGTPGDTGFTLPLALPSYSRIERLAPAGIAELTPVRADIEAANLAVEVAAADKRRATTQLLPRVNSFGRLDWYSADTPFGGRKAWTLGIMVSWSPFSGGREWAQRAAAEGNRLGAEVQAEAAKAQGQLELAQAATALEVALARMTILDTAISQSVEAHRIVRRKYEGGLGTVVEVFDAAALETAIRLGASQARYEAIVALAERQRASGADLAALTSLEEGD